MTQPVITATRNRDRYTRCASCNASAVVMLYANGERGTSTCARHRDLWERRLRGEMKMPK